VLAIAALAGGWLYGWAWLDPATGLVGAVLVALWAKNLIVQSGRVLLDREMDHPVVAEIREVISPAGKRANAANRPPRLAHRQRRLRLRAQPAHPRHGADPAGYPRSVVGA
jgi:Co/Zn/Cd efflux system component